MIERNRLYMPNFSSDKGECINCGHEMSDHDYVSGKFFCLAATAKAMDEIMAAVAECEKLWEFDVRHGFLTAAEVERNRSEFEA